MHPFPWLLFLDGSASPPHLCPQSGGSPVKAWRMLARSAVGSYQIFRQVQVLLPGLPASRLGALGWAPATSVFKPRYFVKYCSELIKTGKADEVK